MLFTAMGFRMEVQRRTSDLSNDSFPFAVFFMDEE